MKVRCKNCYKVLGPQEEYCTNCGAHSEEIEKRLKTGHIELDSMAKLKLSLILFFSIAFLGSGVFMIVFAVIQNKLTSAYNDIVCRANSLLITSIILLVVLLILYRKELKSMIYNGNKEQLIGNILIGVVVVAILVLFSKLTHVTRVIPKYMTDYFASNEVTLENGGGVSIIGLFISMLAITICEEIIFRRRLIDTLDDETLWSEKSIIIVSAIIATILDFSWIMATETILMMFVLNLCMSMIYMNTNRSLGINIILRTVLLIVVFLI